jgi:glutathione synthase/RimK-type ligase-like ATP-grasp enzyme
MKIALATCEALSQLTPDDRQLAASLARLGPSALPAVWSSREIDWTTFDCVVIRSCWDYHLRPAEFRAWIEQLRAADVPLMNRAATLLDNIDKRYLRRLEAQGIPIVPTEWVEQGDEATLRSILSARGWGEAVVKPVVSASALDTLRVARNRVDEQETAFRQLVARSGMMVQSYLAAIEREGEWSFVFFGGELSHAVLKRPRPGDFRVQEEFGGSAVAATPTPRLMREARNCIEASGHYTTYARVDGVVVGRRFLLMELELAEPALFLSLSPDAPSLFARAIVG